MTQSSKAKMPGAPERFDPNNKFLSAGCYRRLGFDPENLSPEERSITVTED